MDEKEVAHIVRSLLEELKNPEYQLPTIASDFEECGIEYSFLGVVAVRAHNYLRFPSEIDVLVSKETYPKIARYFIGHGYSLRPGSGRNLYYEILGGRLPLNIYVEGDKWCGLPLPNPKESRVKILGRWYASLPLLLTLKLRCGDLGDVIELIRQNELGEGFADDLGPDVRDHFLKLLDEVQRSF
jgi:hypothetical protein